MQLDGNIVLCDHSDIDFMGRGYNGALSHLSIYDNALNTTQVLALLHQVLFLLFTHVYPLPATEPCDWAKLHSPFVTA